MKCFKCGSNTKTIYPIISGVQYVQKKCLKCGWKSYRVKVIKIDS